MERTNSMLHRKNSLLDPNHYHYSEKSHYSPAELETVLDRILRGTNPNVTSTPVYFDFKRDARTYRFVPAVDHIATHFAIDGNTILANSAEARRLEDERARRQLEFERAEEAEKNPDLVEQGVSTKILKNQFNYSERASQTMNNPMKKVAIITDPPPAITISNSATAWEIYDAYEEDRINNEKALAAAGKKGKKDDEKRAGQDNQYGDAADAIISSPALLSSLKIVERMVNQNDGSDIIDDYKYWEDQSDMYKDDGNLLPLWKFYSDKVKKRNVTCTTWNPKYNDLFAVGYGSYDFQKQGSGTILCFTLKNAFPTSFQGQMLPTHPEFVFNVDSGVMSLDFHPDEAGLLACGLYDGTVCVFDLNQKNPERRMRPLFQSTVKTGKHTDPVWQVRWSREAGVLRFFSISTDGRVTAWTIAKSELTHSDVMKLTMTDTGDAKDDPEAALIGLSGGMCIDFSPVNENIFVIGTQEGLVRRCTKAFNAHYLDTYEGHSMAVYAVRWNHFHSDIFITCSADWTVKVWIKNSRRPLMTFDLGDAVGDVVWSPYSSTVFAAVTTNGKVLVYDLSKNKNEPLCTQGVVKNAKLTHICFNPKDPIVLVGDSRGTVLSLKLSPNLRQVCKAEKGQPDDPASIRKLEVEKMNRLVEITLKDRELLDR